MSEEAVLPCSPEGADGFLSDPGERVVESLRRGSGNYLVLGAGGKMGLHLCRMLRKGLDRAGVPGRVIAVSRFGSVHDREEFGGAGIETVACDLSDEAQVAGLPLEKNVFFMAGAKFGTAGRPDILQKMNVEMPSLVARHFAGSRITAFSTGCVYAYSRVDSRGSNEESPAEPVGEYALSCLGRERAFERVSLEKGTPVALIRLNYAVEFRYGVLVDIAGKVLRGETIDLSMGHVNVIWQRDAIEYTLLAHERASSPPFILNVTGEGVLRVRDLAEKFGGIFGKAPLFEGSEASEAWLNDASRSHRMFGPPPTDLDQMISWVAAWLQSGLPTLQKPTGYEKRDGKF